MTSFEWDEPKNKENQRKHGVSFEEGQTAFYDDYARFIPDPDHSNGEERFIILGMSVELNLLVVCHCEREEGDVIRIFSARKATKNETNYYLEQLS